MASHDFSLAYVYSHFSLNVHLFFLAVVVLLYWQQFMEPILDYRPDTTLFVDSTTAESTLSTPIHTSQMKHIRTKLLFTREHYRAKTFEMAWLAGENHPPDMLTKALPPQPIIHLRRELRAWGGVCKAKDYTRATRTNLPHHDRTKTAPSFNHTNKNKTPTSKRKRPSTKPDADKRPRRS